MLLMYKEKMRDPRAGPCGTPATTGCCYNGHRMSCGIGTVVQLDQSDR